MQNEVQFAGFGGQGIMLIGKILAHAAMEEGYEVSWVPSYGPEMRGGTAYCTVVISDRPIGSPIIKNPLHLVAMNGPSLEKFAPAVKKDGIIFVNSSLIAFGADRDDADEFRVPVVEIAKELGNVKAANIVALSAFVARSKIVSMETLKACIKEEFSRKPRDADVIHRSVTDGATGRQAIRTVLVLDVRPQKPGRIRQVDPVAQVDLLRTCGDGRFITNTCHLFTGESIDQGGFANIRDAHNHGAQGFPRHTAVRDQLAAKLGNLIDRRTLAGFYWQRLDTFHLIKMLHPAFGDKRICQIALVQNLDARFVATQLLQHRVGTGNRQTGIQDLYHNINFGHIFGDLPLGFRHMPRIPLNCHSTTPHLIS